jgi:serine/threonine protein kinase
VEYAAPEYIQTGQLTLQSDIWSFGIVLLELLTGRRALDICRPRNEWKLVDWARPLLYQSAINSLIDPQLGDRYIFLLLLTDTHADSL